MPLLLSRDHAAIMDADKVALSATEFPTVISGEGSPCHPFEESHVGYAHYTGSFTAPPGSVDRFRVVDADGRWCLVFVDVT